MRWELNTANISHTTVNTTTAAIVAANGVLIINLHSKKKVVWKIIWKVIWKIFYYKAKDCGLESKSGCFEWKKKEKNFF